jgi:hypothetical protein
MDFNIVGKNNIGAVVALLLVVILSQARFFNFLLDNALGRTILIGLILFISYTNQILGVVSVLFIIIFFNNSDLGYMEGFTATTAPVKKDATNTAKSNDTSKSNHESSVNKTNATEGFDITGKESAIKRGKSSNQISVTKTTSVENFEPYSGYSQSYSSF